MNIANNTVATIIYELKEKETGKLIEVINPESPQEFYIGAGMLLESFEKNLTGLKADDTFAFDLPFIQAYGERDPHAVIEIPKDTFEVDGKVDEEQLKIGIRIPMRDNYGNKHIGQVTENHDDHVVMDFNHILAGKDLSFSGKVIGVRETTREELDQLSGGGCGSSCGCSGHGNGQGHHHSHGDEGDDCQVCGNPPEDQGQGIGDCRCS